jgi:hypothetical protein
MLTKVQARAWTDKQRSSMSKISSQSSGANAGRRGRVSTSKTKQITNGRSQTKLSHLTRDDKVYPCDGDRMVVERSSSHCRLGADTETDKRGDPSPAGAHCLPVTASANSNQGLYEPLCKDKTNVARISGQPYVQLSAKLLLERSNSPTPLLPGNGVRMSPASLETDGMYETLRWDCDADIRPTFYVQEEPIYGYVWPDGHIIMDESVDVTVESRQGSEDTSEKREVKAMDNMLSDLQSCASNINPCYSNATPPVRLVSRALHLSLIDFRCIPLSESHGDMPQLLSDYDNTDDVISPVSFCSSAELCDQCSCPQVSIISRAGYCYDGHGEHDMDSNIIDDVSMLSYDVNKQYLPRLTSQADSGTLPWHVMTGREADRQQQGTPVSGIISYYVNWQSDTDCSSTDSWPYVIFEPTHQL